MNRIHVSRQNSYNLVRATEAVWTCWPESYARRTRDWNAEVPRLQCLKNSCERLRPKTLILWKVTRDLPLALIPRQYFTFKAFFFTPPAKPEIYSRLFWLLALRQERAPTLTGPLPRLPEINEDEFLVQPSKIRNFVALDNAPLKTQRPRVSCRACLAPTLAYCLAGLTARLTSSWPCLANPAWRILLVKAQDMSLIISSRRIQTKPSTRH